MHHTTRNGQGQLGHRLEYAGSEYVLKIPSPNPATLNAMAGEKHPADATLLDVLIDGFEKNEMLGGFHDRLLPLPDEAAAVQKFAALTEEAARWKGAPLRSEEREGRRLSAWLDLEVRQAGRGVMVRARAPRFDSWWHDTSTWNDDPMGAIFAWLDEGRSASPDD